MTTQHNSNSNSNSNNNSNSNSNSNEDDKQHHLYDDDGDTGNLPSSQTIRRRKRSHTTVGIPLHLLVGPAPGRPRPRRTERTTNAMEICSSSAASSSVVSFDEAVTMHHVENYRYSLLPTEKQTVWYTSWEMTRLMAAHGRSRRSCCCSGSAAQDDHEHEHEDGDKKDEDAMEVEQQHQRRRRHQQMQKRQKDTRTRQIMEENNRRNQEFLMSLNRRFSIGESSTNS